MCNTKTIHFERAARELNMAQKRGVKVSGP